MDLSGSGTGFTNKDDSSNDPGDYRGMDLDSSDTNNTQIPSTGPTFPDTTSSPESEPTESTPDNTPPTHADQQHDDTQASDATNILQRIFSQTYRRQTRASPSPEITFTSPSPPTIPILIILCISCGGAVRLTNAPVRIHNYLGFRQHITDTIIPTQCESCSQASSYLSERLTGRPASFCEHPSFINADMWSGWNNVRTLCSIFGVDFSRAESQKLVTRQADYWEIIRDRSVGVHGVRLRVVNGEPGRLSAVVLENWSSERFFRRPWQRM